MSQGSHILDNIIFDFGSNENISFTEEEVSLVLDLNSTVSNANLTYTHNQTSAAAEWVVNHNLVRQPSITILNTASMTVIANIIHISVNQARVYFSTPVAGRALCI